ncbi:MAG: leucine-rich repeat protein [Clostridia bacterium]|nr:leucine-rich repeat protein [Clostridia bacterium]
MSKKNKNTPPLNEADNNAQPRINDQEVHLDIPEDEIWTYQVPGLAAPHIGKPYKYFTLKKIVFTVTIVIAVALSCYFSILAIANKDTFEYETTDSGAYRLSKFSNTGVMTELNIDYVTTVEYDQITKEYVFTKDESKKVTEIRSYSLNCDDKIKTIYIGADVEFIQSQAFYSCWALENIEVDENNPYYCDIDGVLYNKDKTVLINYPCNHDEYLRKKYGYESESYRADSTEQYILDVQTYVVPSTVTTLGEHCFGYANIRTLYLPEGLTRMETLSVFKLHEPKDEWGNTPSLDNIYSYTATDVADTKFSSIEALGTVYNSLPEGLEYIGSDALSYNQALTYIYIPESVTFIGHHAFWDDVYKESGNLMGVTQINVAQSEESFKADVKTGDSWRPQYDYMLFKKSVDVIYSAQRQ